MSYPSGSASVYGKGCYSCLIEYTEDLKKELKQVGIEDITLYYRENELNLLKLRESLNVPPDMQSYTTVTIDDKFIFEGQVPVKIIKDFIANRTQEYENIVVFYNELKDSYKIIVNKGTIIDCNIKNSIFECIESYQPTDRGRSIFTLVLVSGFLDGINPCAFSVLLFFIAFLFSAETMTSPQNAYKKVTFIGIVYIGSVFLAYLLIGLTLFKFITITPFPHFINKVGALVVIALGLVNIKDYFRRNHGFSLRMPISGWKTIRVWMRKLTLPATIVTGLLVGIFEFPCTGSIYFAITGLLATQLTFFEGFAYLILYNLAFISPLLAILALAIIQKRSSFSIEIWKIKGEKPLKLLSGLIFITLGIFLLTLEFF